MHLCNSQTIIPMDFFFFSPAGSFPLRGKALAGFGGQSLPDEHGWQYLPSISLVSHGRKQPEVQLVRERDPFRAGINPLTGNKAERAITHPGSDRPMKVKRFFFSSQDDFYSCHRVRGVCINRILHTHTGTKAGTSACGRVKRGKKRKNMTTLFGKQWCHTHTLCHYKDPRMKRVTATCQWNVHEGAKL